MTSRKRAKARRVQASFGPSWELGRTLVAMRRLVKDSRTWRVIMLGIVLKRLRALHAATQRLRLARESAYLREEHRKAANRVRWGLQP